MTIRQPDGSIESIQRVDVPSPVIDLSDSGARELGDRYWREIVRVTRGLVVPRVTSSGLDLRLLPRGPRLLRFAPAVVRLESTCVSCSYAIAGGVLAARAEGAIAFSQRGVERTRLQAAVTGFVPRFGGAFYERIQQRIHVAISRRYFRRLLEEKR